MHIGVRMRGNLRERVREVMRSLMIRGRSIRALLIGLRLCRERRGKGQLKGKTNNKTNTSNSKATPKPNRPQKTNKSSTKNPKP